MRSQQASQILLKMKVFSALVVLACVASSFAIVCTPELCKGVHQPLLDCEGRVIEKGGFCGCTDVCAGADGDYCALSQSGSIGLFLGRPAPPPCAEGFECMASSDHSLGGVGQCERKIEATTEKPWTACQRMYQLRMISFAIWEGQWTPVCKADGSFAGQQCDNTQKCFCVTPIEGKVVSKKVSKTEVASLNCGE